MEGNLIIVNIIKGLLFDSSLCFITEEFDCYNNPITTIVTTEYTYSYPMPCKQLLQIVLLLRGSNLKSSLQTSKKILHKKKLVPILIDYQKKLVLLPVYPLRSKENTFYNPFNIITIKPVNNKQSNIIFKKGRTLVIPLSANTIHKKQLHAQQLLNNITYYLNYPMNPDDFKPFI